VRRFLSSIDDVLLNTLGAVLAAQATRPWWRSRSGDDSEDNLITLCSVCHGCLHHSS